MRRLDRREAATSRGSSAEEDTPRPAGPAASAPWSVVVLLSVLCLAPVNAARHPHASSADDTLPPDFVARHIVLREANELFERRLADPYFIQSTISGSLPTHLGVRRRIEQVNGFPNLEDSIFTHRPNVLETTGNELLVFGGEPSHTSYNMSDHVHMIQVGVRNLGKYRLSWAGIVMGCYSLSKEDENWSSTSWAKLPRPVSVSDQKNLPDADPGMRTWASTPELNGDSERNLSWCLSPPGFIEQAGIKLNFTLTSTTLRTGDFTLDSLKAALEDNIDDPREMMKLMRTSFDTALEESWTNANSVLRVRVSETGLKQVPDGDPATDYFNRETQDKVALLLRRGVTRFYNNIWGRQALVDFTSEIEPPAVLDTELLLAITSAVGGTVVEDIILQQVIEGRTIIRSPQATQAGEIARSARKTLRFTLVLFMATADMLPILFVFLNEQDRAAWIGQAVRSYFGASPVDYTAGNQTRPPAHAIYLTLETWRIQVVDTRTVLIGTFVAVAILLHVFMLGYRAWFLLFSHTKEQTRIFGTMLQTKLRNRSHPPA